MVVNGKKKKLYLKKATGSGNIQTLYQGVKLDNDPFERDIYVSCPNCGHQVFDSGLSNELK